jgi:large subunit ribosomal protein L3
VTVGERKASRVSKPQAGHFAKAQTAAGRKVAEFRTEADAELELGAEIKVDIFEAGQKIDISGITKGKGFAGVVKRYGFGGGDATHGNSLAHRAPGSIGQCQTPGRVFKGKRMAGHMGDKKRTLQNLSVVKVDAERNLLLVKGSVPGATGSDVIIRPAVKA